MEVKSIAECLKGSILQYFWSSQCSCHLDLSPVYFWVAVLHRFYCMVIQLLGEKVNDYIQITWMAYQTKNKLTAQTWDGSCEVLSDINQSNKKIYVRWPNDWKYTVELISRSMQAISLASVSLKLVNNFYTLRDIDYDWKVYISGQDCMPHVIMVVLPCFLFELSPLNNIIIGSRQCVACKNGCSPLLPVWVISLNA